MAEVTVRSAQLSDVAEIARIQLDTWRLAYSGLVGDRALAELDAEQVALAWSDTVRQGPAAVYVATEGRWTVGFCSAGPTPADEVANAGGELPADATSVGLISTLLVEPRWGRRGHGGRLLAAAAADLRASGAVRGICWVPEEDRASLNFYARAGWTPDGTVRILDTGGGVLREVRLTGGLDLTLSD